MVSTISILGVDDSVAPQDLVDLSITYPFVEWGVNLCPDTEPKPGFPSDEWLEELLKYSGKLRLRGVLNSRYNSDILDGTDSLKLENPELWDSFNRIQVDIRNHENISDVVLNDPTKILQTDNPVYFKAGILLPRNNIFTYPDYCGYTILDTDVCLLSKITKKSFWISVGGFRAEDNITMNLSNVEEFLSNAEDYVTHYSLMQALKGNSLPKNWRVK
jgi:hypothetical protein